MFDNFRNSANKFLIFNKKFLPPFYVLYTPIKGKCARILLTGFVS